MVQVQAHVMGTVQEAKEAGTLMSPPSLFTQQGQVNSRSPLNSCLLLLRSLSCWEALSMSLLA